jgi:hypothetical protein
MVNKSTARITADYSSRRSDEAQDIPLARRKELAQIGAAILGNHHGEEITH